MGARLAKVKQQPGAEDPGRGKRANGPHQPLKVPRVAEPTLGDAFASEPWQASPRDKACVRAQPIGNRFAVVERPRQYLPRPRSRFQGEGDPSTRQRPDQRAGLTGDQQAVGDQATWTGPEIERPASRAAGG